MVLFILSQRRTKRRTQEQGVHLDGAPRARALRPDGEDREQVPLNRCHCGQGAALTESGNGSRDFPLGGETLAKDPSPSVASGLPVPAPCTSAQAEDDRAGGALSRKATPRRAWQGHAPWACLLAEKYSPQPRSLLQLLLILTISLCVLLDFILTTLHHR